jgi:NAD(P)-dependent dehydrogenase (short-subunit alcohol dehydrogenase family)
MMSNAGKTAVITGASGGIGAETALRLRASMPALERLVFCARNTDKAEEVAARVREAAGSGLKTHVVPLELASLASVRKCADEVARELGGAPLDVLINNAGVMACPLAFTSDGIELQYGVNHVGAAALTMALLPSLRVSDDPRVVFVSSMAIQLARGLEVPPTMEANLIENVRAEKYEKWRAYGQSKLAMSMFAKALAAKEPVLTSVSLHPGVVMTDLGRHITPATLTRITDWSPFLRSIFRKAMSMVGLLTPEEGSQMTLDIVGARADELENGCFYGSQTLKAFTIPMLSNDAQCHELFDNTLAYLESKLDVGTTANSLAQ